MFQHADIVWKVGCDSSVIEAWILRHAAGFRACPKRHPPP